MASNVGQIRRHRSSAARNLNQDEQTSNIAYLCAQLESNLAFVAKGACNEVINIADDIRRELAADINSKDIFRRAGGLTATLVVLEAVCLHHGTSNDFQHLDATRTAASMLLLLSGAIDMHYGNGRFFASRLNGWSRLKKCMSAADDQLLLNGSEDEVQASARLFASLLRLCLGEEDGLRLAPLSSGGDGLASYVTKTSNAPEITGHEIILQPQAWACLMRISLLRKSPTAGGPAIKLQKSILSLIRKINACSVRNSVAVWESGIISEISQQWLARNAPENIVDERKLILKSVSWLGCQTLDDAAALFRRAAESKDARTFLLEMLRTSKGPAYIQFDLSKTGYSSIELPSLPRAFPPPAGYALAAWVRFDDFDDRTHTTLFGAFDQTQTCFILVYLERSSHTLILQTSVTNPRPSARFKSTQFVVGKWYHIAVVHRRASADARQSPAMLFLNGEFVEQVKVGYPDSPPSLDDTPRRRSPSRGNIRRTRPVQAFFGTPNALGLGQSEERVASRWSMASAHVYQSPLTDEFVAVHHKLGPRYYGNLQDCLGPYLTYRASAELNRYNELLHPEKADKSDIVTATEQHGSDVLPETRLLLSISPLAVIRCSNTSAEAASTIYSLDKRSLLRYEELARAGETIAINSAVPTVNEAMGRSFGTAVLKGEPVLVLRKPLDDASWCLSGSLPMLVKILESAMTKTAFLQAAEIFFECIKDNWRISEAMEKSNGFALFALILREKLGFESGASASHVPGRKPCTTIQFEDRQTLPIELLGRVLDFVGYDMHSRENSMIVNPMGYRVLLIDFDTWRRCDGETQKLYYDQFVHFSARNKHHSFNYKRLSRMKAIKKLVEAAKLEDIPQDSVAPLISALKALLESGPAHSSYRDLAMFVTFGLQEGRNLPSQPLRGLVSTVKLRQRAASWARRGSCRPGTPGGVATVPARPLVGRAELATRVLELLADVLCDERSSSATRRFARAMPVRWLLHLLSESDARVVCLALRIISRSLASLGSEFKRSFAEKNNGFVTMKARLKAFWRTPALWVLCFAMLFGRSVSSAALSADFSLFGLIETLQVSDSLTVVNPELLQPIMAMLEAALRGTVESDEPVVADVKLVTTVIQFLSELYQRCAPFREFAGSSRYMQEILFVLYPVVVGSDRLSAETEFHAEKDALSFKGEEVPMRPHSNSVGDKPPSVRSLQMDSQKRAPSSANAPKRVPAPRRLSSFIMVHQNGNKVGASPARFNPAMAPKTTEPVKLNIGNSLVESLLEVGVNLFLDLICNKKEFSGLGLFLKVPPGFREHQAYFESYVLVHTLSQLWNHLQLNQGVLQETRVLTNLGRYCLHMAEAVFEGWFINGAQPVIDFIGKVLDYLQQPNISSIKNVRLCAQATNTMRLVFLRVTLLRLSELDESIDEAEATTFLDQMNYWQTILFTSENQETPFIRLICFLLYMKLTSTVLSVRLAAARLWRTILVQKPTETATLLTYAMGSEQRHLSTGFMNLVSLDDEEFIKWVDANRTELDSIFVDSLSKPWEDFVADENRRNEESAKARLSKRREKLRQWQADEANTDNLMHRYEVNTNHWRFNSHGQERLKMQRAIQDHQENVHHLFTVFARLEKLMRQPCGLDATPGNMKWQLDETEGINRMRMRTLLDLGGSRETYQPKRKFSERQSVGRLAINTELGRMSKEDVLTPLPNTPFPEDTDGAGEQENGELRQSDSVSNSQLLEGGFEMVDEPEEDDGIFEDKNRKVLTSLQRGDVVQQLYNVSRIVGLEACEGLLIIGKTCLYLQDSFFQRSDGEIVSVSQAPEDERDPYVQLISGKDVGSQRSKSNLVDHASRHWVWAEVLSISKRRFLFRDVSLEVFFTDGRSYLLTCMSTKVRDDLYGAITSRAAHVHSTTTIASEDAWRLDNLRNPEEAPQTFGSRFANVFSGTTAHAATKKWIKGEMSNFQYLMLINTMAGRSFNDLTQYPVFPWVLADYSSEELDLTNPKTFRDFSKPMGCQTPAREAEFKDRYKQFAEMGDQNAPAFNYGTHYSSAMIVTSYLIRLQPFVQSYLLLQGGSFDHADRLFDSIEKAWLSASRENMTDVRELTPEFYYLPEFLENINGYDFGVKQGGGETVNNVKLPPWAKGDPHLFIAKHREALESPHVSEHLHQWIDLIFGFKQRGEAAIEATNVFQHLSYGGAKDLDTINDSVERLATIGIIHSFGQTPHQVFQRPHAGRESEEFATARMDTMAESLTRLPSPLFKSDEKVTGLTFSLTQERLLCAGSCRLDMLPDCDRFVQWGYADHSIRYFSSSTKRALGLYENAHIGSVTTAVFADSKTLITAGADCTLGVWTVSANRDSVEMIAKTYLFGHRAPISILAASRVFSTLISISTDGHVLLWDLNRHDCIRVLLPPSDKPIQATQISSVSGHIMICRDLEILLFTLNGHLLVSQKVCDAPDDHMLCGAFYNGNGNEWVERELLFTGHAHGVVNVWALTSLRDGAWHLQLVNRLNHIDASREDGGNSAAGITAVLPLANAVYTGDEDGKVFEWDVVHRQPSVGGRGR